MDEYVLHPRNPSLASISSCDTYKLLSSSSSRVGSKRDNASRCCVLGGNAGASSGEELLLPSVCRVVAVAVAVVDDDDVSCSPAMVVAFVAVAIAVVLLLMVLLLVVVLPLVLLLLLLVM